jgi:hypothetical protein
MPYPEAQQGKAEQHEDVLTLPEAAAYLRVTDVPLPEMFAALAV